MNDLTKSFYSKVLLFGEYSLLMNSDALAVPYNLFQGKLGFTKQGNAINKDVELAGFLQFVKNFFEKSQQDWGFDYTSMEFDVGQGLFFDSTIPQGFGVGSSGALVAALFTRYGKNNSKAILQGHEIVKLKRIFAKLEAYFHGSSSGVDPLISYLNTPLLIKGREELGAIDIPQYDDGEGGMFLLSTGRSRRTEPLMNLFLEKSNTPSFVSDCKKYLIPITNSCIVDFLGGEISSLANNFHALSEFQFHNFKPMIPKLFQDIWAKGLKDKNFSLKLCGAGGGGFILGMTRDLKQSAAALKDQEIRVIYRF
jgi:mevalonate kinase